MSSHVLIIGDFHVPDRAREIPLPLVNSVNMHGKFDRVACTGDLTKVATIEPYLHSWSDTVITVLGNMDYDSRNAKFHPRTADFVISAGGTTGDIKFGIIHGHQIHPRGDASALAERAVKMGADALISGHTHAMSVIMKRHEGSNKNILLINPGSASGAWSFVSSMKPSYIIMIFESGDDSTVVTVEYHEFSGKDESTWSESFLFRNGSFSR
ncbi:MAG: YfcE family phosphodiesterase [Promethearchaeota archaeon]